MAVSFLQQLACRRRPASQQAFVRTPIFLKARAATPPLGSFFAGSAAILYLDVRMNLEPPTLVAAWMTIADGHRAVARTTKERGKAEMIDRQRGRYEEGHDV